MAELDFDANAVAPATGEYEPLPVGTYPLAVTASEVMKPEPGKVGLKMTLQVLEGEQQGKTMPLYLNIEHPNPVAREIAQKELSALCRVTGVLQLKDSSQLHDRPFLAKVKVTAPSSKKQADGTTKEYGAGNAVSQYLYLDGKTLKGEVVGAIAAAPARTVAPWKKQA